MQKSVPVGTLLTITAEADGKLTDYTSTVLGYGRYGLQVSLPQVLDRIYSLPATTQIACSFVSSSTNQLLGFDSYVMGYERTEPPCMVIESPRDVHSANRRGALRLPVDVKVGYIVEGKEVYGEQTKTLDLSLDGLKMGTGRILDKGALLQLTLDLPEGTVLLTGKVSWSTFRGRRAAAGVQFLRVPLSAQAALAKFLGGKERELRGHKLGHL